MNIAGIDYNLKYKSLDIYISGCKGPHCDSCHNPELWDFNCGKDWCLWKKKINQQLSSGMVENIMLFGGDALDQEQDTLEFMLLWLRSISNCKICLFTRYEIDDIPYKIKQYCYYIKTGRYNKELESYTDPLTGITLASTNQRMFLVKDCILKKSLDKPRDLM